MSTPPFQITPKILSLSSQIQEKLGELKTISKIIKPSIQLRKENRIKTIQFSLAIEGNSLNADQITALIENKRVLAPQKDILEVQNALLLYDQIREFNPLKEKDLLRAHKILMSKLIPSAGKYRGGAVGIIKNGQVNKIAPPARQVPRLMGDLFNFLTRDEFSFLIRSCVFHYELELIHPFEDGNGRLGRLWHQLLLMKHFDGFEYIAIESVIYRKQKIYYKALEKSDLKGDSTPFIEFSLEIILEAITEYLESSNQGRLTGKERINQAIEYFDTKTFSRKEYQQFHKGLSSATASRDLALAIKQNKLTARGKKATTVYTKLGPLKVSKK